MLLRNTHTYTGRHIYMIYAYTLSWDAWFLYAFALPTPPLLWIKILTCLVLQAHFPEYCTLVLCIQLHAEVFGGNGNTIELRASARALPPEMA